MEILLYLGIVAALWVGWATITLGYEYYDYKKHPSRYYKFGNPRKVWWLYYTIPLFYIVLVPVNVVTIIIQYFKLLRDYRKTGQVSWTVVDKGFYENKKAEEFLATWLHAFDCEVGDVDVSSESLLKAAIQELARARDLDITESKVVSDITIFFAAEGKCHYVSIWNTHRPESAMVEVYSARWWLNFPFGVLVNSYCDRHYGTIAPEASNDNVTK